MRYFVGLDVSLKMTNVCVIDADGARVREAAIATEPAALIEFLEPYRRSCARVGLESCSLSEWLYLDLAKAGLPVVCIEARHAHLMLKANINKTDRNDARGIATIMRTGVFRPVHIKSPESRQHRTLLTVRRLVQTKIIDIESGIFSIVRSLGFKPRRASARTFESDVARLLEGRSDLAGLIQPLIDIRRCLRAQFDALDSQLRRLAGSDPVCRRLMTAPGIGPVTALTYRCVIDVPERFRRSQTVGAHIGLTPKTRQSGETDIRGRISKRGDRSLRSALYNGANSVLSPRCKDQLLRGWALQIAARRGRHKAVIALARRLAVILHRMWCDGTDYRARPALS